MRVSADGANPHQVVAGVAVQLFTLGIPCIYYGTEQALSGPPGLRQRLDPNSDKDVYLRETMFGPVRSQPDAWTSANDLVGFGPFGTCGAHVFDENYEVYVRIRHLIQIRQSFPVLRFGPQYLRPISNFDAAFSPSAAGEIFAWSRILAQQEVLIVVNGHGQEHRGGDVLVDFDLNRDGSFVVIGNSLQAVQGGHYQETHPLGSRLEVFTHGDVRFVSVRGLGPSEVLVLSNQIS